LYSIKKFDDRQRRFNGITSLLYRYKICHRNILTAGRPVQALIVKPDSKKVSCNHTVLSQRFRHVQVEAKLHELTRSSISSNVFTAVLASYDTAPNKIITTEFKHHQGPYYTYVIFRRQLLLAVKLKIQHVAT